MNDTMQWEARQSSRFGGAEFLRLKVGQTKVRFVGRPLQVWEEPYRAGEKRQQRYLSHVYHQGQLRVLKFPPSVYDVLSMYADGDPSRITGPNAPEFIIGGRGEKLDRRYAVMADKPALVPADFDPKEADQVLWRLGEKLERRKPAAE